MPDCQIEDGASPSAKLKNLTENISNNYQSLRQIADQHALDSFFAAKRAFDKLVETRKKKIEDKLISIEVRKEVEIFAKKETFTKEAIAEARAKHAAQQAGTSSTPTGTSTEEYDKDDEPVNLKGGDFLEGIKPTDFKLDDIVLDDQSVNTQTELVFIPDDDNGDNVDNTSDNIDVYDVDVQMSEQHEKNQEHEGKRDEEEKKDEEPLVDNQTVDTQTPLIDLENKFHNLTKDTNSGKKSAEVESSEAEDEIEMQDWSKKDLIKGDLRHLEDVIRIVKEKTKEDNEIIINRIAKIEKALKNFMNHSLEVLRISSQNMNALVDHLERKSQNTDMAIIDDIPTSSSTHQIFKRRTRQTINDMETKMKDLQLKQENNDLREAAKAMMFIEFKTGFVGGGGGGGAAPPPPPDDMSVDVALKKTTIIWTATEIAFDSLAIPV
ncbi:uncharacterized protein LOC131039712 [Cryptomeria japonica]|uniref:uncharacterized protein LOC131039712 n=1 Tax=Cryptomeria japonica TaxID=3369 RepID=UPI0025AD264C|nr:uncharacterized protein LOC131039712 [Cryptomeria japonica]